ncbi:MAG: response regulator [Candidatus Wallbacteria bacterium]|nr:response regulator [Candidatus Wallbacteria bacterium]
MVLVVGPEQELRDYVGDLLRQADYTVYTAASAFEARARLRDLYPDLMLLDACLPEADGLLAEQRLRFGGGPFRLPVVFLGSPDSAEELRRGYEQGALCHIFKGDGVRRLPQLLECALERLEFERNPD